MLKNCHVKMNGQEVHSLNTIHTLDIFWLTFSTLDTTYCILNFTESRYVRYSELFSTLVPRPGLWIPLVKSSIASMLNKTPRNSSICTIMLLEKSRLDNLEAYLNGRHSSITFIILRRTTLLLKSLSRSKICRQHYRRSFLPRRHKQK